MKAYRLKCGDQLCAIKSINQLKLYVYVYCNIIGTINDRTSLYAVQSPLIELTPLPLLATEHD